MRQEAGKHSTSGNGTGGYGQEGGYIGKRN